MKEKRKILSEEEQLEELSKDGMLIKRPIILYEGKVYIGKEAREFVESL